MEGKETTFYEKKKKILSLACPFVRDISYGIVKCVDVGDFKMNRQASQDCLGTDKGCSSVYAVFVDLKPYASQQGMFWAWAEDFPVVFVLLYRI